MSGSPDEDRLLAVTAAISPPDLEAMERARQRQDQLTKPAGALGRLEDLAVQVAGITGSDRPSRGRKLAVVFAADHGVVAEGVSAYPSTVTAQMVRSFVSGTAAVSVLARTLGRVCIPTSTG